MSGSRRRLALPALGLALAGAAWGCGGPCASALQAFEEARYPEAVGEYRRLEGQAASWDGQERLRYALYRGLAHLAVGDAVEADRWITRVKRAWDADPEVLDAADRGRLLSAWRSMGRMPGERR